MIVPFRDDWREYPCVEWQGSSYPQGYGRAGERNKGYAHREVWKEHHPETHLSRVDVVMHACDNPPCYRIEHLGLGSRADNAADRDSKGRYVRPVVQPKVVRKHDEKIPEIQEALRRGVSRDATARMFGVCNAVVDRARKLISDSS